MLGLLRNPVSSPAQGPPTDSSPTKAVNSMPKDEDGEHNLPFSPSRRTMGPPYILEREPSVTSGGLLRIGKRMPSQQTPRKPSAMTLGRRQATATFTADFVKDEYATIRTRCYRNLGAGVGAFAFNTSCHELLYWIKTERLTRLPHKGGSWDRVLIAAEYFAIQIDRLGRALETFVPDCGAASNLVFGQCLYLLELGHENASALLAAFRLLFQLGLELTPLLRAGVFLDRQASISEQVGRAFIELMSIVSIVAGTYHSAVHGIRGKDSTATLDIYSVVDAPISSFRKRVENCSSEIWRFVLKHTDTDDDGLGQVEELRRWLVPQDKTLAFLALNHINLTGQPEEFTCIWFEDHLKSLFKGKDDVLFVEGGVGTGKTYLANWAVDRLQRRICGLTVSTLSFFFNSSVMEQATALGMLKTLLSQLLAQRIGDMDLLNTIDRAYAESSLSDAKTQENILWQLLEDALSKVDYNAGEGLVIIVDGVDEMDGLKPEATPVAKRLHDLVKRVHNNLLKRFSADIRLILFSQALPSFSSDATVNKVRLSPDTHDDVQIVIRQGLLVHPHYRDRDYSEQEHIVESIATVSRGSLLRAFLEVQFLSLQKDHAAFNQAFDTIIKSQGTVSDTVQRLLPLMSLGPESKALLSLLAAVERPLQLHEATRLLRADPPRSGMFEKPASLGPVVQSVAVLTVFSDGLVALRHDAIKQALVSIPSTSKVSLNLKERHRDLLMRLFISVKKYLQNEDEPCLGFLDQSKVENRIGNHHLVDYAVRYWTVHFRKSSLFKVNGNLDLPETFRSIFPGSVGFVLLESTCWKAHFPHEAKELYNIAFRVRKSLFGQEHPAVLQSALICAMFFADVLSSYKEAIEWYAIAVHIGKIVLGLQSDIVISCCHTLLRISETFVSKTRTEIMTYREEILLVLVSSYTHRYGESSKEVLEIYKKLLEFYEFIAEEEKATAISVKIKQITVAVHGRHSSEYEKISRKFDEVVLKKHDHADAIETGFLFEYEDEASEEGLTMVRVDIILRAARKHVKCKRFTAAEGVYVELWLMLSQHCRTILISEWHEKMIRVVLEYVSILYNLKRFEEASAALLVVWEEYEHHQLSMFESIIILLKEVAVCMKSLGLLSIALLVFQKCWSWFRTSRKEDTTICKEIEEHITVTSKEIVKKSATTAVTSSSETIIRDVFESSMSEATFSSTTVELCQSLTSIYFEEGRYFEAVSVIKSALKKSWASFFESVESTTLPTKFYSESVELVIKLAECYISQKRYEKAEFLYLRLYRVHRKCHGVDHATVIQCSERYIAFLRKQEMFTQLISFYQELLVEYEAFYGASHSKTIAILYALGDVCSRHHLTHGYWIEYYIKIVVTLNQGSLICNEDAFKALVIVAEHYYETLRYSESIVYFKTIIATFRKFGTKFKYFEDVTVVQALIEKYFRAIEETDVDIHLHITILKEIREACFKYFGESAPISISVTLTLAEVSCRSEKYELESISYYEHILKHSKSVSSSVLKSSQATVKSLCVRQVTSSTSSKSVTKEVIDRATTMSYESYLEIRKTHACTHETTLAHLKELVTLYHKQSKSELAIKELRSLIIECIFKVTSARELIETARVLAAIFVSCGYQSQGLEIIQELRLQVIYKRVTKSFGFNVTNVGHQCVAFIAAFEFHLQVHSTQTIDMLMAELMAEYLSYQRFTASIHSKATVKVVFVNAARLRQIIARSPRGLEVFVAGEEKAIEYFRSIETAVVQNVSLKSVETFVKVFLEYLSQRGGRTKNFVGSAGHAAVQKLRTLLASHLYKDALELAECTHVYLMAHEGLDDPSEISLGFQLCLMMAGRGENSWHKHSQGGTGDKKTSGTAVDHSVTHQHMLELSRRILREVLDICERYSISLARCPMVELNELIGLIGDAQKDGDRLQWLLVNLWKSRSALQHAADSDWSQDVVLELGKRTVQAQFAAAMASGKEDGSAAAIKMAQGLVYNVRRVHGPRHKQTLSFYSLLASLYTTMAIKHQSHVNQKDGKNGANGGKKKERAALQASVYFKKAIQVHEDVLKLLVDNDTDGSDEDEDDVDSAMTLTDPRSPALGSPVGSRDVSMGYKYSPTSPVKAAINKSATFTMSSDGTYDTVQPKQNLLRKQSIYSLASRDEEVEAVRKHLRLLKLAVQRFGGWINHLSKPVFESLTQKVAASFGPELKMPEEQILAGKWKVDGFGEGKCESSSADEGGFVVPSTWMILHD